MPCLALEPLTFSFCLFVNRWKTDLTTECSICRLFKSSNARRDFDLCWCSVCTKGEENTRVGFFWWKAFVKFLIGHLSKVQLWGQWWVFYLIQIRWDYILMDELWNQVSVEELFLIARINTPKYQNKVKSKVNIVMFRSLQILKKLRFVVVSYDGEH